MGSDFSEQIVFGRALSSEYVGFVVLTLYTVSVYVSTVSLGLGQGEPIKVSLHTITVSVITN